MSYITLGDLGLHGGHGGGHHGGGHGGGGRRWGGGGPWFYPYPYDPVYPSEIVIIDPTSSDDDDDGMGDFSTGLKEFAVNAGVKVGVAFAVAAVVGLAVGRALRT